MRLFVAVNFGSGVCARLTSLQGELRGKSRRGSFTLPGNIHLTLTFLGECSGEQTAAAKAALDAVCFEPFTIEIDRVGCFKRGDGDIWWAGVSESKPLLVLQNQLTDKLTDEGFVLDSRKYSPHITLGRRVEGDITGWSIEPFVETVLSVELMKSERIHGKLRYTRVYRKAAEPI